MIINLDQTSKNYEYWHCWVCERGGKNLKSLIKQLYKIGRILSSKFSEFNSIYSPYKVNSDINDDEIIINLLDNGLNNIEETQYTITLPPEFISLSSGSVKSPDYRNALNYVINKRKLTKFDIVKYNIGYCEDGRYAGRIIIPSYNSLSLPNYFQARLFYEDNASEKYINPHIDTNRIIPFEIFINWKEPVIFVEGMFDAITLRRNAIPTLGKNIFDRVLYNIYKYDTREIYLFYDPDALDFSYELAEKFITEGRNVYILESPNEKDPADLGYEECSKLIRKAHPTLMSDILKYKFK